MRWIVVFIILFFHFFALAQTAALKKANQLFKEEKYATAIPHYENALAEKQSLASQTKLAFCYKMTNQIDKAVSIYSEIVQHERAKDKTYFYYAEALMSNGRYDEAKSWFKKYAALNPEDGSIKEKIAACDFAKTIPPYFNFVAIKSFPQNSDVDDNSPVFWDGGIVFTSDRKGKIKFLDTKSGWTGRDYLQIYHSKQQADGSFEKPKEYISKINGIRKNTGMASFQPDGSALFFTKNGIHLSRQNAYCLQIFQATSKDGKKWKKPKLLPFCSKEYNYMHPAISPDGKQLFFVSDRPKGMGGTDIYVSQKTKRGWEKPQNLGEKINTEGHEGFPFLHQNGKLYFCSKGHRGLGGFDIFVTTQDENGNWTTPVNLGQPINSPADDISIFIDKNEQKGLFTSSREGGDDDIYLLYFFDEGLDTSAVDTSKTTSLPTEKIAIQTAATPDFEVLQTKSTILEKNKTENLPKEILPPIERTDFSLFEELIKNEELKKGMIFSLPTIQFVEEEHFVTFKIAAELDKIAAILEKHSGIIAEIAAHTANLGTFEDKKALTDKRAKAIVSYLLEKGIPSIRLHAQGYGGKYPLNNCKMDIDCPIEKHRINDRIELQILAK